MRDTRTTIIEVLEKLVAAPSFVDETEVTEVVAGLLGGIGMDVCLQDVAENRQNVIGSKQFGEGGPTFVFNTHMDVVPPGIGWSQDPFSLFICGDRAYARGACDAKGSLAAMLTALKKITKVPGCLRGKIIVTAVVDEEGASSGSRKLFRDLKADYGLVGEPTNCRVAICHKGSLRPVVRIEGKAAHASHPTLGVNAIEGASSFIMELRKYQEELEKTKHPLLGAPTATVTLIKGGVKENVVPDQCDLVIDRRMVPGETEEQVLENLKELCNLVSLSIPGSKAGVTSLVPTTGGPSEIEPSNLLVKTALQVVKEVTGDCEGPVGLNCGCDMVHLVGAGIPTVVIGPGSIEQAHKPDEYVSVIQLEMASRIYESIIRRLLS